MQSSKYNPKQTTNIPDFVFGSVTPQMQEVEKAVLGAILNDQDTFSIAAPLLRESAFYSDAHKAIWRAIYSLGGGANTRPIDLLTVTEELRSLALLDDIGGAYYLVELTNRVLLATNTEYHCRLLLQAEMQRAMVLHGSAAMRDAYDPTCDPFEALFKADESLKAIAEIPLRVEKRTSVGEIALELIARVTAAQSAVLTGVPSGFSELDRLTGGFQKSDLIILAARPSMGKSAVAFQIALNAAMSGVPTAIFSLEMPTREVLNRNAMSLSGVSSEALKGNIYLSEHDLMKYSKTLQQISEMPLFYNDTAIASVADITAQIWQYNRQNAKKIGIVVIDYLQLMGGDLGVRYASTHEKIGAITKGLKSLAKRLDVPIVLLSQLSRAVESRGGTKRPQLSDLRDSGSIEEDADIVSFIYRPEYYKIMEDENGNSTKGLLTLLVEKHRNGALKDINLRFYGATQRVEDWENATVFASNSAIDRDSDSPVLEDLPF